MSEVKVLDLSAAVPADVDVLEIKYPGSGEGTGWKIELAGPSHAKTVALAKDIAREQLQKAKRIEQAQANGRKYKVDDENADDIARRNVTLIAQRIIGWSPDPLFKQISDQPIAFSEAAAIDLLLRFDMGWVLGQISDFLRDDASFTQASAKT